MAEITRCTQLAMQLSSYVPQRCAHKGRHIRLRHAFENKSELKKKLFKCIRQEGSLEDKLPATATANYHLNTGCQFLKCEIKSWIGSVQGADPKRILPDTSSGIPKNY